MTIPTVEQADRLAKSVYQHRLGLKPKENVVIEASPSTIKWAGGFVREARRRGARPLLQYEDETSYWTAIQEGHADRLGTPGEHEWAALDEADVYIFFFGPEHARRRAQLSEATLEKVTAYNGRWYERARR